MIIARINTDNTIVTGHYRELFPDTSFSQTGPNEQWFLENNCYMVSAYKIHDADTEQLVSSDPYLEDGTVYTVRVETIPPS